MGRRLGLVLGDQLFATNPVFDYLDRERDHVVMGELADETDYVWHHGQKIVLIFSAMRHFAAERRREGWDVHYHRFRADAQSRCFSDLVERHCRDHDIEEIILTWPGEWRTYHEVCGWSQSLAIPVHVLEDDRFLCSRDDFEQWAQGRKQLRMEYFYRQMRKATGYLMDGDHPAGGQWNFDADNRKAWRGDPPVPSPMQFTPDMTTREVMELVEEHIDSFGEIEGFDYPVTPAQARRALTHFIDRALACFGDYQDAMHGNERYLFHSRLSASLNIGLLLPSEVCDAVEQAWRDGKVPINAAEGFIRQVIGWREYVRGIYWREMPEYARRNALLSRRELPSFYWTGETGMNCLARTIDSTRRTAYAHHIQRLMVTGNFALILGVLPRAICEWYLAVYADAFDWVELPNTLGMVMHADGGLMASKPYAASGNYINRMSDYCRGCRYQVSKTTEEAACPFNALYWDFLIRNRERLAHNHRMGMMYRNLDRMNEDRVEAITRRAEWIKRNVELL
jgi:deoxyribodipyrimidine photolyase-related protein